MILSDEARNVLLSFFDIMLLKNPLNSEVSIASCEYKFGIAEDFTDLIEKKTRDQAFVPDFPFLKAENKLEYSNHFIIHRKILL